MGIKINQTTNTRNQSTLTYDITRIFIGNNKYNTAVFLNNTGGELELQPYILVIRNTSDATQIVPAVAGATLENVVGILATNSVNTLADGATLDVHFCYAGDIDETHIQLPSTVTLGTLVGAKTVRDILNDNGLNLSASVSNFKLDN